MSMLLMLLFFIFSSNLSANLLLKNIGGWWVIVNDDKCKLYIKDGFEIDNVTVNYAIEIIDYSAEKKPSVLMDGDEVLISIFVLVADEYGERIDINSFYGSYNIDYVASKYNGIFLIENNSENDFISLLIERDELSFDVVVGNNEVLSLFVNSSDFMDKYNKFKMCGMNN
ncbi:hypothetical protein [Shewanella marina]|uniref:hypothetical protein n=1 Tax=Shewanella marina TaxID=487319 RepID=UPI00047030F8|nr:hypothetical protein [Shewanella marina]